MSETKICETCKHEANEPDETPCSKCEKASEWKSRNEGCEFCRDNEEKKIGYIEISCFEFRDKKHLTVIVYDDELGLEAIDEESFDINYCPKCGAKLVKR